MEVSVVRLDGCDKPGPALNAFVSTWIDTAMDAGGESVKVTAQLLVRDRCRQ